MEGHYELKIYLLRSLVNWGTLLKLFPNLKADLVRLQRHLCGTSMLAQLLSLYIKTQTLNVRFHSSPSLTISMVGLVFASTFLYNFVFPGVFDFSASRKAYLTIQGTPMVVRYSSKPSLFSCWKTPTAFSILTVKVKHSLGKICKIKYILNQ